MLNLDHIKLLEDRVEKAVNLIKTLSDEKDLLKMEIEERDKRISELENLILVFKDDQLKIEQGIVNALNQLSAFESSVYEKKQDSPNKGSSAGTVSSAQTEGAGSGNAAQKGGTAPAGALEDGGGKGVSENAGESLENNENLQKDLNDVLGSAADVGKQMDIF